jgi:hypothetical protein
MSPTDLRDRLTRADAAMGRRSRALYAGLTGNVVLFTALAFVFPMPLERIGCVLTALGWACVVLQRHRHHVGQRSRDTTAGVPSIDFYRSNLQRERDFAAAWPWFFAAGPGPVTFFVGITQQYPDSKRLVYVVFFPILLILVAISIARQVGRARRYQHEIDDLAQLQWEHA